MTPRDRSERSFALAVLLVGGAAAAGAYFWMNTEKPVPTAAQSNGDKVKAEMQKAEREAAAKAPPVESTPPEVTPTRGARGVKEESATRHLLRWPVNFLRTTSENNGMFSNLKYLLGGAVRPVEIQP